MVSSSTEACDGPVNPCAALAPAASSTRYPPPPPPPPSTLNPKPNDPMTQQFVGGPVFNVKVGDSGASRVLDLSSKPEDGREGGGGGRLRLSRT